MEKVIEGTHAASHGARLARAQVIAAYPITPSSSVVELLSEMCATGELNARFIKVESEHSAMAACVGASAAGARAFTATSSQGLALMHELLHWAGGGRLPIVLVNVNRAMGPPWTIYADQNDSLSQRDTGWMQYYCESNQEVLDTILITYKISEKVLLPSMLNLDAFFLSHTCEPVDIPDQQLVDDFLPPYRREMKIDPKEPHTYGALARPDSYMELRVKMQQAMDEALLLVDSVGEEFEKTFGRKYSHLEEYKCDGAEMLLVTSGTITSTARIVIDRMREKGIPVGLIKARLFRPFPVEEYRRVFSGIRKVGVVDRNISYGAGGIFYQEIRSAMYNAEHRPDIFGFIAGLGGRDVTPETITEIIHYLMESDKPDREIIWIGVKE